jgi:hypothetical protein
MRILVHACCGPCLIYPSQALAEAGHSITAFYYNPNIHPDVEYAARAGSFRRFCAMSGVSFTETPYDAEHHKAAVTAFDGNRCLACYRLRLRESAREAASGGYDAFTTTLLVSPYQKHEELRTAGLEAAEKHGIEFFYQDFRPGFRQARNKARELGLYSQKYCGCEDSRRERFAKTP